MHAYQYDDNTMIFEFSKQETDNYKLTVSEVSKGPGMMSAMTRNLISHLVELSRQTLHFTAREINVAFGNSEDGSTCIIISEDNVHNLQRSGLFAGIPDKKEEYELGEDFEDIFDDDEYEDDDDDEEIPGFESLELGFVISSDLVGEFYDICKDIKKQMSINVDSRLYKTSRGNYALCVRPIKQEDEEKDDKYKKNFLSLMGRMQEYRDLSYGLIDDYYENYYPLIPEKAIEKLCTSA